MRTSCGFSASYKNMRFFCIVAALGLRGFSVLYGQAKPDTDVLLFVDGERLTGHFVRSSGSSLTFKSDALGELTVDWSKVKELTSSAKVAVIPKNVRLRKPGDAANVAKGTLSMQDQQLHLTGEQPRSIPVAESSTV